MSVSKLECKWVQNMSMWVQVNKSANECKGKCKWGSGWSHWYNCFLNAILSILKESAKSSAKNECFLKSITYLSAKRWVHKIALSYALNSMSKLECKCVETSI